MDDLLQKFVGSHPEFFEKTGDCYALRSDIHDLVEQYARLVDNDEYERVRALVESIRKENQEQREEDIRKKVNEIKRLRSEIPMIETHLDAQDDAIRDMDRRIAEIRMEIDRMSIAKMPWYHSSIVFWLLMGCGLGTMYIGISIRVNGASSLLIFGAFLCVLGCVLQGSQPPLDQAKGGQISHLREKQGQLESRKQLAKIKRATFLQQKSVAKQSIQDLQGSMDNR
jgi:hypothetical protein